MSVLFFLGLHVDVGGIVSEKYLPEPAMGNMKPDSPAYAEKYAEKQARAREDAFHDPVLAVPLRVQAWFFRGLVGGDHAFEHDATHAQQSINLKWEDRDKIYEALSSLPPVVVFGLHPTTHVRILTCSFLRMGRPIPPCLRQGHYIVHNPWRELGTQLEYPASAKALDLPGKDPIEDSWLLIRSLGVPNTCLT